MSGEDTQLGADLVEAMAEVAAWARGDIALAVRELDPMPPERIPASRRVAAKSPRDFERRYHVPMRTL